VMSNHRPLFISSSAQVQGRQRVLLVSPAQALHGLYPFPVHHTYDTYAMIDLERPDADLWPSSVQVTSRRSHSLVTSPRNFRCARTRTATRGCGQSHRRGMSLRCLNCRCDARRSVASGAFFSRETFSSSPNSGPLLRSTHDAKGASDLPDKL
jgi:hypothetical protein